MSKLNRPTVAPFGNSTGVAGPIRTAKVPTLNTYEGAPAYERDAKSELFLLAVSNFVGEDTFSEKAADRDQRYRDLIHQVAVADPAWMAQFLSWLRNKANMRAASIVGAVEATRAMVAAGIAGGRALVNSVLTRADEPGDTLAYFVNNYGRKIPKPIKRGIADAATRLYTQRNVLKYDTASKGFRFADVLELCHVAPASLLQPTLFKHIIDRRHGREGIPSSLTMIHNNAKVREAWGRSDDRNWFLSPEVFRDAGMTWEDVLSGLGGKVNKKDLWEAIIPSMGYMALLRNLRNFDEAGIGDEMATRVARRLSDSEEVAKSRQLPFRFWSAYKAAPSLRWGYALELALGHCLKNIPTWEGRTLVLVDTSASMTSMTFSAKSTVTPAIAAGIFGVALKCKDPKNVDLVEFATTAARVQIGAGASVLKAVESFLSTNGRVGHGTDVAGALRASYNGHDRVIIISDMQTMTGDVTGQVPAHIPMYAFNLGGYKPAMMATESNRVELGGLTDQTFALIANLEAARSQGWPWEVAS